MTLRKATAYKRRARLVVHASSRTTDGVWVLDEPCIGLDVHCEDEELGAAARQALASSRDGVPHPSNWSGVLQPLLAAAGVRSWNTFAKSASCIELEDRDGALFLFPTANLGATEGFERQDALKLECTMANDSTLGATIRKLFQH